MYSIYLHNAHSSEKKKKPLKYMHVKGSDKRNARTENHENTYETNCTLHMVSYLMTGSDPARGFLPYFDFPPSREEVESASPVLSPRHFRVLTVELTY